MKETHSPHDSGKTSGQPILTGLLLGVLALIVSGILLWGKIRERDIPTLSELLVMKGIEETNPGRIREVIGMFERTLPREVVLEQQIRLSWVQVMPGAEIGGFRIGALLENLGETHRDANGLVLELLGKDASVIYRIGLEPGAEWGYIAPEKENWVTFLVDNPPDFIAVQFRYLPGKAEDLSS